MTTEPSRSAVALTNTKQMRALAHPLRMEILGELRINGPRTVGALSEVFDEAPGTLSYHLGKLAEFGFVVEAPERARDRRQSWWRAAHDFTNIPSVDASASPEERRASAAVRHRVVDVYAATLHRAVESTGMLPPEWATAANSADSVAFLTAGELAEASAELNAVVDKWYARGDQQRAGAEAVQFIIHSFRRS